MSSVLGERASSQHRPAKYFSHSHYRSHSSINRCNQPDRRAMERKHFQPGWNLLDTRGTIHPDWLQAWPGLWNLFRAANSLLRGSGASDDHRWDIPVRGTKCCRRIHLPVRGLRTAPDTNGWIAVIPIFGNTGTASHVDRYPCTDHRDFYIYIRPLRKF